MPKLKIEDKGCRGCQLCVDTCPTKVLAMDAAGERAQVLREEDCIGCTSCAYLCPSRCITVSDYVMQRPFHRIEENRTLVERFLQQKTAAQVLGDADYEEARRDASVRLSALSEAIDATMGRGQKACGRKAGQLMAEHLPEMYEAKDVAQALERVRHRFEHCFDFQAKVDDGTITLHFDHCALADVVKAQGGQIGKALLCTLFHEYCVGLVGAFASKTYNAEATEVGAHCTVRLQTQQ